MNAKKLSLILLLAVPAFAAAPKAVPTAQVVPVTKTQSTAKSGRAALQHAKTRAHAPKGRHQVVKPGTVR